MYANLKEIEKRAGLPMFVMSVSYLLDYGFRRVAEITDEDIEQFEGNGLMTKEYVQSLVRTAREIARECGNNVTEIIQYCQCESVFDTKWYKGDDDEEEEGEW